MSIWLQLQATSGIRNGIKPEDALPSFSIVVPHLYDLLRTVMRRTRKLLWFSITLFLVRVRWRAPTIHTSCDFYLFIYLFSYLFLINLRKPSSARTKVCCIPYDCYGASLELRLLARKRILCTIGIYVSSYVRFFVRVIGIHVR